MPRGSIRHPPRTASWVVCLFASFLLLAACGDPTPRERTSAGSFVDLSCPLRDPSLPTAIPTEQWTPEWLSDWSDKLTRSHRQQIGERLTQLIDLHSPADGLPRQELLIDSFGESLSLDAGIEKAQALIVGTVSAQYLEWTAVGDPRAEVLISELDTPAGVQRVAQWISVDCVGEALGLGYDPLVRPLDAGRQYALLAVKAAESPAAWTGITGFVYEVVDGGRIAAWNEHVRPEGAAPGTVGELRARFDERH